MPKIKRMKGKEKKKSTRVRSASPLCSDDEEQYKDFQPTDPKSSDNYYDEIDTFHAQKDKILLGNKELHSDEESREEEEILPLSDDSDESDFEDEFTAKLKADAMASDLEDEEQGLPDVKAWGKKASTYYNTNFVDQDFRRGYREEDLEAAGAEEREAMALQKRLIEDIDEADYGLEWFKAEKKAPEQMIEMEEEEKVAKDFSKLSQREKLELLTKESPELLELIKDFRDQLTELEVNLQPLLPLVNDGRIPPGPEACYIRTKYQLILHYCTNISYYMILKARGIPVRYHPVIKRLLNYRTLLKKLESCDSKLRKEIALAVKKLKNGEDITFMPWNETHSEKMPRLRILQNLSQERPLGDSKQKNSSKKLMDDVKDQTQKMKKVKHFETEEEKEILSMFENMAAKKRASLNLEEEQETMNDVEEAETSRISNEGDQDEKRGITYEIAKNKGLLPKRKKEYRNPRVRHRMKFQRAKIRRKGQVREARKELQRYGGEISGIRIGVTRSVKLK